jgi:hypothetical protein
MRMPKHILKLLALPVFAVIAPASAGHLASSDQARSDCPYERAEFAAAGYDSMVLTTEGDPAEGSLLDPGRRSAFLP